MVRWRNFSLRRYLTFTCFRFFVTPSDSVAIIAANAVGAIPYFSGGLKGVARYNSGAPPLLCVCTSVFVPMYAAVFGLGSGNILAVLMICFVKDLFVKPTSLLLYLWAT